MNSFISIKAEEGNLKESGILKTIKKKHWHKQHKNCQQLLKLIPYYMFNPEDQSELWKNF